MRTCIAIVACFMSCVSFGQLILHEVHFEGKTKNKPSYIQNYVTAEIGKPVTLQQLEADRKNLVNMPDYGHVELSIDSFPDYVEATFELFEVQTFTPIFDFGGIRENIFWQVGVANASALGYGLSYNLSYRNTDQRGNYFLHLQLPFVKGKPFGVELLASRDATLEPIDFRDQQVRYFYDRDNLALSGSYFINPRSIFKLTTSFFTEGFLIQEGSLLDFPNEFTYRKMLFSQEYSHNNEDYFFYLIKGYSWMTKATQVVNLDQNFHFASVQAQFKYFARIKRRGNFAMRLFTGIATNTDTPFAPFVLDSNLNIRGSGNRQERGTSSVVVNAEHRHSIYDKKDVAVQLVGFVDSGIWRKPGKAWNFQDIGDELRVFSGGGMRFIYKKYARAIFRIDYGIDLYDFQQQGFVLGLGQHF